LFSFFLFPSASLSTGTLRGFFSICGYESSPYCAEYILLAKDAPVRQRFRMYPDSGPPFRLLRFLLPFFLLFLLFSRSSGSTPTGPYLWMRAQTRSRANCLLRFQRFCMFTPMRISFLSLMDNSLLLSSPGAREFFPGLPIDLNSRVFLEPARQN